MPYKYENGHIPRKITGLLTGSHASTAQEVRRLDSLLMTEQDQQGVIRKHMRQIMVSLFNQPQKGRIERTGVLLNTIVPPQYSPVDRRKLQMLYERDNRIHAYTQNEHLLEKEIIEQAQAADIHDTDALLRDIHESFVANTDVILVASFAQYLDLAINDLKHIQSGYQSTSIENMQLQTPQNSEQLSQLYKHKAVMLNHFFTLLHETSDPESWFRISPETVAAESMILLLLPHDLQGKASRLTPMQLPVEPETLGYLQQLNPEMTTVFQQRYDVIRGSRRDRPE